MKHPFALLALLLCLSACVPAVIGAATETGVTIAEERSAGRKVDDVTMYSAVNRRFLEADANDLLVNVTINVRHARVMLTGNVDAESTAQRAVAEAWKVEGVQEVINEIIVNPNSDFFNNANDALIKKNLEGRLFITKDVWVINYSIDVVSGTAYLLGRVHDNAEMQRVINVTRLTKGVKKVVNHLQIAVDPIAPPTVPQASDYNAPPPSSQPR
jgi:osmotically-inducible protein OsmY